MSEKHLQDPTTWGSLSDDEFRWAAQFGQTLNWDQYQAVRFLFKSKGEYLDNFQDSLEYKTDRRNSIAEAMMAAQVSACNPNIALIPKNLAANALALADALIAHLDANPPKTGDA